MNSESLRSDRAHIVRQWFDEIWNQGKDDLISEHLAENSVIHDGSVTVRGASEFQQYVHTMRSVFSEIRITLHELVAEGDFMVIRWSVTARHGGNGLGFPATGKMVDFTGISIVKFDGLKMSEAWQNWDMLRVMQQLEAAGQPPLYVTHTQT